MVMKTYAAYDEKGIWGIGETPDAARAEAIYWAYPDEAQSDEAQSWALDIAPMTDRLAAQVEQHGFDCNRDRYRVLPDGTLDMDAADVQMIKAKPWEDQGLVEYNGEPEDLDEWLDNLERYTAQVESYGIRGWDEYTHIVRLTPDNDSEPTLYCLVTEEAIKRLGLYLVALGDIARLAGVKLDTVAKWLMRHPDFPAPVAETSAGKIWQREDVIKWLEATGRR